MKQRKLKLGVLGSGSGTNMQAILDAIEAGSLHAEIVLVLSDQEDAFILERARRVGIPAGLIDCGGFRSKFPEEKQAIVAQRLLGAGVDLVCLAGFMRLVKAELLNAFPQRVLNIHPSLLPAYPGLMAWKQAVDDGAAESGCTVHYVDVGMDTGPIIQQARVPVLEGDTAETLHQRIQVQEHRLYPEVIQGMASVLLG
ncbi:phosphoribosylglycinamide formyltransferase [Rubritalea marina]|uniref:phosphoribosylglycinamide formyltransferase n=1 Tax=Rubritalea marina TaxID=361055 RepID=UPI000375D242|nr:phosphoribosylglycinamide formyltransferase [Rubritalea marina]